MFSEKNKRILNKLVREITISENLMRSLRLFVQNNKNIRVILYNYEQYFNNQKILDAVMDACIVASDVSSISSDVVAKNGRGIVFNYNDELWRLIVSALEFQNEYSRNLMHRYS